MFKTWKDCARLQSKQRDGYMMSAGFKEDFVELENCEGRSRPVLYKNEALEFLRREVWMTGDEEAISDVLNLKNRMET